MLRASAIHKQACRARAGTGGVARAAFARHHSRNRNATFSSQRIIIASHVHEQRRGVNQTVDPIKNSAVPGNGRGHVFGPDFAFDHANGKIAQLSADSNDQSGQNQLASAEERKRKSQEPRQNHRHSECAERALPGFVRTDFAAQWMSAENFAKGERGDVTHSRGKNNETNKSVSVARVSQKSEMPEHPADINESDDGERHSLQLAAGAIAQDRNEQDESDREDRHCHKKSIPTGAWFFAAWMRNE